MPLMVCPGCQFERSVKNKSATGRCRACALKAPRRHGLSHSKLDHVYGAMMSRCGFTSHRARSYPRYGGRGISVCEEWRSDRAAFFRWALAHGYKEGLTIERRENEGDYEPGNCVFADRVTQGRNTRRVKLNEDAIRHIRQLMCDGVANITISAEYGIDASHVHKIKDEQLWRGIGPSTRHLINRKIVPL